MAPTGPRHILLYGPPAAGKLTVARALAAAHPVKVLDNHLTVDVALRLFDFGTRDFVRLVERLRMELFEAAATACLDVVSTLVFAHPSDRPHIERLWALLARYDGTVCSVHLCPPAAVLEQRVTEPSRVEVRKLRDVEQLRKTLARWDVYTPIDPDDLSIDNTDVSPEAAAALIAARAGL